ncbi:MAG TPA: CoA transferase [Bryobacteraceae bacterium]|nr:CoA transferase [Bryobacteraceae bacterium]
MEDSSLPLAGITVIDLGQVYQGPYATLLMAQAGANVIKVEPRAGEPLRRRIGAERGSALPFAMLNSNKRAVTLNLKCQRGLELLIEMARRGDVLVENFAPGVMDRLGAGWSVLREINPRLIYASGSGFGLSGPDRDNLAMDLTVQAATGVMSVTGFPDGPPVKAGAAVADFLGGIHLYAATVTALYERVRTGCGRLVEVSMQDAVYPTLASNLGFLYNTRGEVPPRTGNRHGGLAIAPYNVYRAKDGHVAIICAVENHWTNLLTAMGREDLKDDPRFAGNAQRVENLADTDALVQAWTESLSKEEIFALTKRYRVPSAPVRDLREVMHSPHLHQRGMLEWIEHPELGKIAVPGSPLRFHGTDRVATTPSPRLGQHNVEIYGGWLGLSEEDIQRLQKDGVI